MYNHTLKSIAVAPISEMLHSRSDCRDRRDAAVPAPVHTGNTHIVHDRFILFRLAHELTRNLEQPVDVPFSPFCQRSHISAFWAAL